MGIRFRCPNGHRLNVKSFLSGKRGICPRCGAKVIIPLESSVPLERSVPLESSVERKSPVHSTMSPQGDGVQLADDRWVAADLAAGALGANEPRECLAESSIETPAARAHGAGEAASGPPAMTSTNLQSARSGASSGGVELVRTTGQPAATGLAATFGGGLPDPIAESPQAMWYVRPPSGGQFGPASADVMRRWMSKGRVTDDSLVWREGWINWQSARDVLRLPAVGATPPCVVVASQTAVEKTIVVDQDGTRAHVSRHGPTGRRKSIATTLTAVVVLGLISVVLLVGLLHIVMSSSS